MTHNHCPAVVSIAIVAALGTLAGAQPATQPTTNSAAPDYSSFTQSYKLPFARKVNFDDLRGMSVRVSINGGEPMNLQVDTGSVGIIVGAADVPNIDPNAPAGSITYSSSGIELVGVWTDATVTFLDAKDANGNPAVATVPVLAARERRVHGGAVNSGNAKPSNNPRPRMLGMGFGRGKEPHPERNAFVNLKEMQAGTMRRGYTITRDGITLGLTAKDVGSGYVFQKLNERTLLPETAKLRPGLKDWETARGSVVVNGETLPDAAILMDTGLTNMMIASTDKEKRGDVPDGTPITVNLPGGQFSYSFKVADTKDPVTPRRVTWVRSTTGRNSINTGLRALSVFDYLYDADGGYFALRPTAKRP